MRVSSVRSIGATRAEIPSFQSATGEAVARLLTIDAACESLCRAIDDETHDPSQLLLAAIATKHTCLNDAVALVESLLEIVGASAYSNGHELSRLLRDVQAARFHPPTRAATRQALGRWALGLEYAFELDEVARP